MTLSELLDERFSCRGFTSKPVSPDLLNHIFNKAQKSPSNCNVQPWEVILVSGDKKQTLSKNLVDTVITQQQPNPDFNWNVGYEGKHRDRQFGSANALYSAMGIDRQDKIERQKAMLRNWTFFDAPHVAIFTMDIYLDIMGAVDMGIYAQTLSLLLKEKGIDSCMQGAIGQFPNPIKEMFNLPETRGVLFGMSFGYADQSSPANKARTDRVDLNQSVLFSG